MHSNQAKSGLSYCITHQTAWIFLELHLSHKPVLPAGKYNEGQEPVEQKYTN